MLMTPRNLMEFASEKRLLLLKRAINTYRN
jgi:hypothetical protein